MPNTKPTIAETLMSMPDVGEDSDFARAEDSNDKRLAVDLKALIEDGRAGAETLDAMIDQMNQATAIAEAPIDEALAEIDASNQRLESMERKANGEET